IVGIFALVLFFADRRDRSFLLLGLVCLSGGALLLAESWRTVFGYTYDWHFLRLLLVTALSALLNLAIVGFVLVRFPDRFARPVMIALAACLCLALVAPTWDGKALAMFIAGLAAATGWVLRAVRRGKQGSLPALTGLVVTLAALLWRPAEFTDRTLYFALDFLLACLLVAHALQLRSFRREHEEVLVRSARLEIELLRKHIQPHFLMNTLTALSEWIEQDPAVAVSLIESISQEFRLLGRIADRVLIGLGEELDLCRTHIAILSRRRDRNYELRVEGIDARDLVPPAVFHTLVENAITHDASKSERIVLTLSAVPEGERVRYTFTAPGAESAGAKAEGTGLRYIRARLQESLGDDWS
ncbi:MAG: histidine kinase, partial [Acidobacteriota bacterium]